MEKVNIYVLGLVLHVILLYSIFDVYYTSPIIKDLPVHGGGGEQISSRLFFISVDGLRLDTFVNNPDKAPFLHSLIRENKGSWLTSVSHVPTESRPGHVALFAGLPEDVSAVTAGWKHNPVAMDTVFNRSSSSWMWGSMDITALFDHPAHVHSYSFSPHLEDFSSHNNHLLDQWVFDQVEEHLSSSSVSTDPRVIFFLHLVGMDTNGHGFKPHSDIYKDNLLVVDKGIEKLVQQVNKVFVDGRTTFIFTSDHGMTDWGSHGAGSDVEVLTPLFAWGAGIVDGVRNRNISQIDVCPLVASLLSIPVPINSIGILPSFALRATSKQIFSALYGNFLQLREILSAQVRRLRWRPWRRSFGEKAFTSLDEELRKLARSGRWDPGVSLITDHLSSLQQAILSAHRVDRTPLGIACSCSFLAWILLLLLYSTYPSVILSPKPTRPWVVSLLFGVLFCLGCSVPLSHSVYLLLPIYLCSLVAQYMSVITVSSVSSKDLVSICSSVVLIVVVNLAFHERRLVLLLIVSLLWWIRGVPSWVVLCLVPFPFLPPAGRVFWSFLPAFPPIVYSVILRRWGPSLERSRLLDAMISLSFVTGILIAISTAWPNIILRVLNWSVWLCGGWVVWRSPPHSLDRVLSLFTCLFLPFCQISSSYESSFLFLFSFLLHHLAYPPYPYFVSSPSPSFTLSLIVISLFCTGNLASLSSFDPSSLHRLVSVFSPFLMALLLLLKVCIPVLAVVISLSVPRGSRSPSRLLALCDLLAMLFWWQLRDSGSWLDIGVSIAHYVIAMCTAVVLHFLFILAEFLLSTHFVSKKLHFSSA